MSEPRVTQPETWNEFVKVIEHRRSIRVYDGTAISEPDMRDCLRAAILAPNSSNLQPWEFHWVRQPAMKAELVRLCLSQPAAATAGELVVCVARTGTWRKHAKQMLNLLNRPGTPPAVLNYYRKLVPMVYSQGLIGELGWLKGAIMSVVGLFRPVPREPFGKQALLNWATKSTALGCENLMLAFAAKGLDSCPMEGMDSKAIARLLKLPRDAKVVMVISAGRRKPEGVYGARLRFPEGQSIFVHA